MTSPHSFYDTSVSGLKIPPRNRPKTVSLAACFYSRGRNLARPHRSVGEPAEGSLTVKNSLCSSETASGVGLTPCTPLKRRFFLHATNENFFFFARNIKTQNTTHIDGYLGSRNDEKRSESRYLRRIAEFRESSSLRTHIALRASGVCLAERPFFTV
jgi:hypothetical protein